MDLLSKIETLLNALLLKFGAVLYGLIPTPLLRAYDWIMVQWQRVINLPQLISHKARVLYALIRNNMFSFDYKSMLLQTFHASLARYKKSQPGKQLSQAKLILLAPFLMLSGWLQGLSAGQSLLLLGFTSASFLSGVNMIFSCHRIMTASDENSRTPASVESVQSAYDRPGYYKKQNRHLEFIAIRLPIHLPKVNELRSVDVDFNLTLSTRHARELLSKKEFQLRDHLVLNIEPSIASFSLEEEGKEIMRVKLTQEVEAFMKEHQIPGTIQELKITYILAN